MNPSLPFALLFFITVSQLCGAEPATEPKPATVWSGDLAAGQTVIPLVLRLIETNGNLRALFSSPKQMPQEFPAKITLTTDTLLFHVPSLSSHFEGQLSDGGNTATGQWHQGGVKLALVLRKSLQAAVPPKRPQHPKPPYPYQAVEVTFENQPASVRLAGILTLPTTDGPHPAVVLISGSGPQDRDETLFDHKPFLVIADHLTRAGIAVLRYDDRGVGASTGNHDLATTADFADDARAAYNFLAHFENIDPKRVGLIGHSEGGVIAPMVASQTDVAFLVHLAGPTLSGADILRSQFLRRLQNAPERQREQAGAFLEKLITSLLETETGKADPKYLLKLYNEHVAALSPEDREAFLAQKELVTKNAQVATTRWTHHYIKQDPATALSTIRCPVLALFGGKDVQVEAGPNSARLRKLLPETTQLSVHQFAGLNHLFQKAETGEGYEYPLIEETIAPEVLKAMAGFIQAIR